MFSKTTTQQVAAAQQAVSDKKSYRLLNPQSRKFKMVGASLLLPGMQPPSPPVLQNTAGVGSGGETNEVKSGDIIYTSKANLLRQTPKGYSDVAGFRATTTAAEYDTATIHGVADMEGAGLSAQRMTLQAQSVTDDEGNCMFVSNALLIGSTDSIYGE
jgi:hypothetical protein